MESFVFDARIPVVNHDSRVLLSPNASFELVLQADGNLVVYSIRDSQRRAVDALPFTDTNGAPATLVVERSGAVSLCTPSRRWTPAAAQDSAEAEAGLLYLDTEGRLHTLRFDSREQRALYLHWHRLRHLISAGDARARAVPLAQWVPGSRNGCLNNLPADIPRVLECVLVSVAPAAAAATAFIAGVEQLRISGRVALASTSAGLSALVASIAQAAGTSSASTHVVILVSGTDPGGLSVPQTGEHYTVVAVDGAAAEDARVAILQQILRDVNDNTVSFLYAVSSTSASAQARPGDSAAFTLRVPLEPHSIVRFTDRPAREATVLSPAALVQLFEPGQAFALVPPNAVLNFKNEQQEPPRRQSTVQP